MKKKIVSFPCTVKFAKVFPRNMDIGGDENEITQMIAKRGGLYVIDCYPDDPEAFIRDCTEKGVNLHPMGNEFIKKNEQGVYVQLKRYHNPPLDKDGAPIAEFGYAPKVVDADGNPWDEDVNIGNGSECEVAFDVWGKGWTKLRAIKVNNLVEYTPDSVDPSIAWALT